jgi:hypothetical protein
VFVAAVAATLLRLRLIRARTAFIVVGFDGADIHGCRHWVRGAGGSGGL